MTDTDKPKFIANIEEPTKGFGPAPSRLGFDEDEDALEMEIEIDVEEDAEDQQYLYDYAMEYLPRLPQLDLLLEEVELDYSVLVALRAAAETLKDELDATALDDLLSAFLLFSEEDEELQAGLYQELSAGAQQNILDLEDIAHAESAEAVASAPAHARMMMMIGALGDIELSAELLEEGIDVEIEEVEIAASAFVAFTEKGGIPHPLMARAVSSFNQLADKAELAMALRHEGDSLRLDEHRPPAPGAKPPRP